MARTGRRLGIYAALAMAFLAILLTVLSNRPAPVPSTSLSAQDRSVDGLGPAPLLFTAGSPVVLQPIWQADLSLPIVTPPVVTDDLVYVLAGETSQTGRLIALGRDRGQVVWQMALGHVADHAPVVAADLLYVVTRSTRLLVLDRHTGEDVWSFRGQTLISGRPVVEDGVLYVGSEAIFALDAANGKVLWSRSLDGRILQPLELASGILVAIGGDYAINLLDAGRGMPRLSFPLWFSPSGPPRIGSNVVAIAGEKGHVQALALGARDRLGEKAVRFLWTRFWLYGGAPPPPLPRGYAWQVRNQATVGRLMETDGRHFYLSLEDAGGITQLVALAEVTGARTWDLPFSSSPVGLVVANADLLLATTGAGEMIGVDAATGDITWRMGLPGRVVAAPAYAGELMVVPLEGGVVQALRIGSSR